jgi:serine/threonine protein kinase
MELKEVIQRGEYSQPDLSIASVALQSLISRMLDLNPGTRITLEEIIWHPWLYGVTVPTGNAKPPINRQIVRQVAKFGFDEADIH